MIGDLRYLTDAKLDAFTTPLAKAQLAAALAMLGDQARAAGAFGAALRALDAERDGGSRPDYGSRLRDAAAVLALVAEAKLGNIESDAIARAGAVLEQARAERSFLSTQEMNWMTLAAEGLAEHASLAQFRVDGEPVKGALYRRWSGPTLSGQSIVIANAGQNPAQLVVSVSGAPIEPDPAAAHGYAVERSFYKLDGTKLDALQSMAQNERVVVSLKVTEAQARYARLLVVDRLPAGLEIDNPALVDGGSVEAFSWLSKDAEPVAHRISRRPFRGGVRSRGGPVGVHHHGLCRARRGARPLHLSAGDGRGHVRPRTLRPHRLWGFGGEGEVRRAGALIRPFGPPSPEGEGRRTPPFLWDQRRAER